MRWLAMVVGCGLILAGCGPKAETQTETVTKAITVSGDFPENHPQVDLAAQNRMIEREVKKRLKSEHEKLDESESLPPGIAQLDKYTFYVADKKHLPNAFNICGSAGLDPNQLTAKSQGGWWIYCDKPVTVYSPPPTVK